MELDKSGYQFCLFFRRNMKIASKMKLLSDDYLEYERRHNQVYPELELQFKKAGVSCYTIWYDKETNNLFAHIELEDINIWNDIPKSDICKKWWDFMAEIMDVNVDNSPVTSELIKVYDYK